MRLSDFDYQVPEELVAQRPLEKRDASRMLVLHRREGKIEHRQFRNLPEYLCAPDRMIFNRSKVIKARLIGQRESGGKVEIFLLRKLTEGRYECLLKATAAEKIGLEVTFGEVLHGRVLARIQNGMTYEVELRADDDRLDFWIERIGRMPLPPYIHREADGLDVGRYQTVYASDGGSVAAPTAGLHFTEETFARLRARGVKLGHLTLHVRLGTFQPIKAENIEEHRMHEELFSIDREVFEDCISARERGERVLAVGTTSVRGLESAARGMEGSTNLFLRPGSEFKVVTNMLTNFHQPKSSLVVMLAAFVGSRDLLLEAYAKAVEEKYRFFSYGDCMLVL